MRDYQVMRGFDTTTSDFARHCGFYDFVFEPVESSLATTSSRFEELDVADSQHETTEDVSKSFPVLFGDVPVESPFLVHSSSSIDDMPEPAESSSASVWSGLASSFLQAALRVSDILAMGF
ncbi:hypothetical protein V5O48_006014 [Marasmius crinis-equi]|uniref:Uncharacterized protein n=1 Tax=Marasmius crinis-equi TaxID=585013 RepID=A0ABR3FL25_9AGAR